jgi:hypothetical protein
MNNTFFFQTQQIPDSSSIFDKLKEQNIFYSYFQVDQNYYLFLYAQQSIDIKLLYQSVQIIQELDSKQRKIRSLRGFFLYALKIMENGEEYEILNTNLQPFFWRNLKSILRQNKKTVLLQFLFGRGYSYPPSSSHFEDQIQTLKNQVDSLQQKIIELEENQKLNFKKALSELLKRPQASKIDQQADYTFKSEDSPQSANLLENESEVNLEVQEPVDEILKTVSEDKIKRVTPLSNTQQNLSSNQEKGLNGPNFITLSKIPEEEQIEIIQKGFQLNQQGKISLKNCYESTQEYSLFQSKGYNIKYESIRRTKLYKTK